MHDVKFRRMANIIILATLLLFLLLCIYWNLNEKVHADGPSIANLEQAALLRLESNVVYDGSYQKIAYPNGDVASDRGVCTDVVIRAYRELGIDLQELVHQDMQKNFSEYPDRWGLSKPDSNIDHRRVPNLRTFLQRQKASLAISENPEDYHAGDVVSWVLANNLPHIGIVVSQKSVDGKRPLIVHNIGYGTSLDDFLFAAKITGHYRYSIDEMPISK